MGKKKKKISLTSRIFIGLILGVITGIILHYFIPEGYIRDDIFVNGILYVVGQGFVRAMQMLVVPLVFFSLVTGTMSMGDTKKLGKIGIRTIIFYLCTTALAIAIAIALAKLINPGVGINVAQEATNTEVAKKAPGFAEVLLNIIPKNPVKAMSDGVMLQIIFFALLVGVILARLGEQIQIIGNIMNEMNDIMMDMTSIVMHVAPIGVFALITRTFTTIGYDALFEMLKYILTVMVALFIQGTVVYMILLKLLSGLNPITFLRKFVPVIGFAFSTASSNATVPLTINTLSNMGISKKISSFTIPLGATINMDGTAIMQGVAVVFVANVYGIDLGMQQFLTVIAAATLASIGTAGIPSVGLITLSMVFESVGLPVAGIAMIMGIDRILDMTRTAVNVTGDAVCTAIIAKSNDLVDADTYNAKIEE